jgi:hypothetical protein
MTDEDRQIENQNLLWLRTHGWIVITEHGVRLTRPESPPEVQS